MRKKKVRYAFALVCVMLFESLGYSAYGLRGQTQNALAYAPFIQNKEKYTSTWETIQAYDPGVYRVQIVSVGLNDGLVYGIPSTMAYDSVYQYPLHDFLEWIRQYPDVSWSFNVDVPDIDPLLNVRYILLDNPTPELIGYYKYWADEIDLNTPLTVLKLKESTSFARTITSITTETLVEPYMDETIPLNGLLVELSNTIVTNSSDYEQLQTLTSDHLHLYNPTTFTDNAWTISLEPSDTDYLLFIAQSYDNGWSYHDQDGGALQSFKVQGGFTAVKIPANTKSIDAHYTVPGLTAAVVISSLSVYTLIIFRSVTIYFNKNKKRTSLS